MNILEEMFKHAAEDPKNEVCGIVVNGLKKSYLIRGVNQHQQPHMLLDMSPDVWLQVPDGHEAVATYHSHPSGDTTPSMADRVACEATNMPMFIVTRVGGYERIEPSGYQAPYVGRPYVYGTLDCYTVVIDWYMREFGIKLNNYDTKQGWWANDQNLYLENYPKEGFVEVRDMPVQHGDVFLLQVRSEVPNHAVIWLKGGTILHHPQDRLSRIDPWTGFWAQHAVAHLRHTKRMT